MNRKYGTIKLSLALGIALFTFLLPLTIKPYGMAAYVIPATSWLIIFALLWNDIQDVKGFTSRLIWLMPFAVTLRFLIDLGAASFVGFGKNINFGNPVIMATNIITIMPFVLGFESLRYALIRRSRTRWWETLTVATFMTALLFSPARYLTVMGGSETAVNFILRTFVPMLATNTFITQTAVWGGVKPAITFSLLNSLYIYLMPLLPNTPWYLTPLLKLFTPLAQLALIEAYIKFPGRRIRAIFLHRGTLRASLEKGMTASLLAIATLILVFAALGGRVFVVTSGSMEPGIMPGDLAVVYPSGNADVGDVIAFKGPQGPILHRVAFTVHKDGVLYYQTKGDANSGPDPFQITKESIIGKLVFIIPKLGIPVLYGVIALGGFLNFATALITAIFFAHFFNISKKRL